MPLLCVLGCARSAPSGGQLGQKPLAPKPVQAADNAPPTSESLYGSTSYDLVAVLVNKQNSAAALPTLRINGSRKSTVQKRFSRVIAEYEAELAAALQKTSNTLAKIKTASAELDDAEKQLTEEYSTIRPTAAQGPTATSRNPLRELSKVRATKTKADDWFKTAYAERVEPLKSTLTGLYKQKIEDQLAVEFLQAGFKDRLFAALDAIPNEDRRQWTTDTQGKSTITVPNDEPWAIWAETTHSTTVAWVTKRNIEATHRMVETWGANDYEIQTETTVNETTYPQLKTTKVRWLLHIPEDLDDNKKLVIDQESAFDLQSVSIELTDDNDEKYVRRGGK